MRVSAAGTCTGAQSCLGVKLVGVAIQGPPNTAQTESTLPPPPPPTASPGVPRTAYTTAEAELYASRKLTTHSPPTLSPAPPIPAPPAPSPPASPRRRPQSAPARAGRALGIPHRKLSFVTERPPPVDKTQVHHSTLRRRVPCPRVRHVHTVPQLLTHVRPRRQPVTAPPHRR